jgi:hypothetical protein
MTRFPIAVMALFLLTCERTPEAVARGDDPQAARRRPSTQAPAAPAKTNELKLVTPPGQDPAPVPTTDARRVVVTEDGSIETTLPDGRKRITRPGHCGFTVIMPDGTKTAVQCMQTQPATPPLPTEAGARWLEAHNAGLLSIVQALLNHDQTSLDNYMRNHETTQQTIYDKILIRTETISKLTAPN